MKRLISLIMVSMLILTACGKDKKVTSPKEDETIKKNHIVSTVTYPESIGYDDYDAKEKNYKDNPVKEETINAIGDFSYKTAKMLLSDTTANQNYSPISLYYALAIAANGANGDTKEEILNLLGTKNINELQNESKNLFNLLYKDNEMGKLKIANSLWLKNDINFKEEFLKSAAEYYYASSHNVDFKNPETSKIMSQWIKENTNGVLSPTIKTTGEEILSIINTIYFYDEWKNAFSEENTAPDIFHGINGDETVDFLNEDGFFQGFYKGDDFTRSSLYLKNRGKMVFILPNEEKTIAEILDKNSFNSLFETKNDIYSTVTWKIPKFSFGQSYELIDMLNDLGVKKAFTKAADFSNLSDKESFISDVIQESHIAINEEGVEAAAFTQIIMEGTGGPPFETGEMILDRPFIYAIIDETNIPIFIGTVNHIKD